MAYRRQMFERLSIIMKSCARRLRATRVMRGHTKIRHLNSTRTHANVAATHYMQRPKNAKLLTGPDCKKTYGRVSSSRHQTAIPIRRFPRLKSLTDRFVKLLYPRSALKKQRRNIQPVTAHRRNHMTFQKA